MELITLLKSESHQTRCFPAGGCSADFGLPERWHLFFMGTSINLLGTGLGYKRAHFYKVQERIFFFIVFFYFPFNATARQALAQQYPAEFPVPRMLSCLEKKGS